ncbi:MAG: methionine aminotransferase [Flavobacteriales bacterium]|nr:methionine aminotransferase [Flavobacteriales bacterium]
MRFPLEISSKLPKQGASIFTTMSALANQHNALNLSQGFPNFPCPPELIEYVHEAMLAGQNQYAPMAGVPVLREKLAEKTRELYGATYDAEKEITVVPGGTMGIYAAITALVREGDEVVIIEPAYDSYVPAIELNGGRPIRIELSYPDFRIDWNEFKKVINFRTRMIILNSPHNPTGTLLDAEGIKQLARIVDGNDIIILSDEVYEHIVFDGLPHESMAKYPELAKRSLIVSSFGKTYHTTGWKLGYVVGPEKLMREFRKVYQFMAFSAHTPSQYAYARILDNKALYHELAAFYQHKRDLFADALKSSRFEVLPCKGSYFQLLKYDKISDMKDTDFAKELTVKYQIASIPISVFYLSRRDEHILRFCFAKDDETLLKAAEILCKI